MTRILVVDNYDSFVYTIVGYLDQLGAATVVVRNDAVPGVAERAGYDGVLISPGPGTPRSAGQSLQVIRDCADAGQPMLGVCLGHQALGEAFGATVTHAPELMHGKTSHVVHDGVGSPARTPAPSCTTWLVLPCISSGAWVTVAPNASPSAWCPRHTPVS